MHRPVLLQEVLELFNPQPGQTYVDMTVNGGGHALKIAERVGPVGRVLGIDWDADLVRRLQMENQERGIKNIDVICDNYARIAAIAKDRGITEVNGIIFDLGFSSYHVDESGRGFSFRTDEPLDMRYSPASNAITAEKIINHDPEETIENIIREYGEERYAGRIARAIASARRRGRITTTRALADIVWHAVPAPYRRGRIHPATRTFQSLRIAVNHELENLQTALAEATPLLAQKGIMIVISFHSLEERAVKNFFKQKSQERIFEIMTEKPMHASRQEIAINPRSRSARLRAARKII